MISQIFVEILHPLLASLWKLQIFLFPAELILLGTYVVYRALEPILLRALKNRISAGIIRLFSKMLKVSVILLGLGSLVLRWLLHYRMRSVIYWRAL